LEIREEVVAAKSAPLEFLSRSQTDPKLSSQVAKAVEKGGMTTADEVMRIAKNAGYSFTSEEFETAVRGSIEARFKAGDQTLSRVVNATGALESSCSKGCLSLTISWHPDEVKTAASRPTR
jgi:predicted ribosomally synthesized peptide with nif11-like leader